MKKAIILVLSIVFLNACDMKQKPAEIEKWKQEIIQTEKDFAKMAKEVGIEQAFLFYAADDAVLMRNNNVIQTKENIKIYFGEQLVDESVRLTWEPDFVDVSLSGDLAYTFGKYNYSFADENGVRVEKNGIFHTVWKRQKDGLWKFVWD